MAAKREKYPSLFSYIPEEYRRDPHIRAFIGLLSSAALSGGKEGIKPEVAPLFAQYAGELLLDGAAEPSEALRRILEEDEAASDRA